MAKFYPLNVISVVPETRDAVVVQLAPNPQDALAFAFTQGQHLTFRKAFDGQDIRRSYSICTAPNSGDLRVAIKKVAGGCFSTWANESLRPGDVLEAMAPAGNFHVPLQPAGNRHYLGFAAGSGITPILSHLKTILTAEPKASFTLIYGNKSPLTMMFRDELEDLKNQHMDRLSLLHILGSENDLELFAGRIDRAKMDALLAGWIDVAQADVAFICGPEAMMQDVSAALQDHGMNKTNIKFELFGAAQQGRAARPPSAGTATVADRQCDAVITIDGVTRSVKIPPTGQSILDAALAADLGAPFSCRAGVCSTCKARVVSGEFEMLANYALEDYEIERGYVLTCQAYPQGDKIIVDYDQ